MVYTWLSCRSHSFFPLQEPSQIADRTNVPQLIRVDDRAHGLDLSASYVKREDSDQLPSAVEEKGARLTVHLDLMQHRSTEEPALASPGQQRARDAAATVQRLCQGPHLTTAVTVQHHVLGQQRLQRSQIARMRSREEALCQLVALLARGRKARPPLRDLAARPCGELAGVGFARTPPEFLQAGDVMEAEVERIGTLRNRVVANARMS